MCHDFSYTASIMSTVLIDLYHSAVPTVEEFSQYDRVGWCKGEHKVPAPNSKAGSPLAGKLESKLKQDVEDFWAARSDETPERHNNY